MSQPLRVGPLVGARSDPHLPQRLRMRQRVVLHWQGGPSEHMVLTSRCPGSLKALRFCFECLCPTGSSERVRPERGLVVLGWASGSVRITNRSPP